MNRTSEQRRGTSRRGSALVEFAIVSSLLLGMLGMACDVSRVFQRSMIVTSAARAGVQYGIATPSHWKDLAGMRTAALRGGAGVPGLTASATSFCTCSDGRATTCGSGTCSAQRAYVQVVTSAAFETVGKWPMIPHSIPLKGSAVVRIR